MRDSGVFTYFQVLLNIFLLPLQIRVADEFWTWTNNILIPAVFPAIDSVPIVDDDRLVQNSAMYLTGPVRFRQLRVNNDG